MARTIPIHKKGPKKDIENYRPIANLCSASKIFEKLILRRINEIAEENKVDITNTRQHGYKKTKGTLTLGLELQSIIARALDENNHVLMASLDLSAAFDVVNTKLLMKRLKIIGLPDDVIKLIDVWLSERTFYVDLNGKTSILIELICGTIQGSILGPILYAIYVSPVFDITDMYNFADDNFIIQAHINKTFLCENMQTELIKLVKWLKGSGLKVNESKTELCLFYKLDVAPVTLNISGNVISSKTSMGVLGVIFDSKLQWVQHIASAIKKANQALSAIKLIKKYFTKKELLELLTANYYSRLYYNSEIWLLNSLNSRIKQQLLSASARAIKCTMYYPDQDISYKRIHEMNDRATPEMFTLYKVSLLLHKSYNRKTVENEWIYLNLQHQFSIRGDLFKVTKTNKRKVGNNIMVNRLSVLNDRIPLAWLNLSYESFKLKSKGLFLKW